VALTRDDLRKLKHLQNHVPAAIRELNQMWEELIPAREYINRLSDHLEQNPSVERLIVECVAIVRMTLNVRQAEEERQYLLQLAQQELDKE
jgi:hypothetical protein